MNPRLVIMQEQKRIGHIVNFGNAPFTKVDVSGKKSAFLSNGFVILFTYNNKAFALQTKVGTPNGTALYKCYEIQVEYYQVIKSGGQNLSWETHVINGADAVWDESPSEAFSRLQMINKTNMKIFNLIGSSNIQELFSKKFPKEYEMVIGETFMEVEEEDDDDENEEDDFEDEFGDLESGEEEEEEDFEIFSPGNLAGKD